MLYDVGGNGYSWALTVTSDYACRLNLAFNTTVPSDYGYRAHGLQTRCLQE
ncbi:MAG: hypothetical protein K2G93_07095 [Rikenella sp.]|nr:hypothetical protein [Rikenella sp.]